MASHRHFLLFLLLAIAAFNVQGQRVRLAEDQQSPRYIARIEVNTAAELNQLLQRAEQLFDSGNFATGTDTPIAFVLHGAEARSLLRPNYQQNKQLVDLAARLSAFKVVEIRVCKTWMGGEGLDEAQLPPFISTVPLAANTQQQMLKEERYVYF